MHTVCLGFTQAQVKSELNFDDDYGSFTMDCEERKPQENMNRNLNPTYTMSACKQMRSMQESVKTLSIWGDLDGKDLDDTEVRIQGDEPAQMAYMFEHPINA